MPQWFPGVLFNHSGDWSDFMIGPNNALGEFR
jgi:hypothetical protein